MSNEEVEKAIEFIGSSQKSVQNQNLYTRHGCENSLLLNVFTACTDFRDEPDFVEKGLPVNAKDNYGRTALTFAQYQEQSQTGRTEFQDIIKLLKAAGAK